MKRNLILLGVLTVLLIGTYVFQEKRTDEAYQESLTKDQLVAVDAIVHLKWADVDAVKKDGKWWNGSELLSHNTLKQIEKKISQIRKVKDVAGNRASYFNDAFDFEVNHEKWSLGDLTLDRQGFYLSRNDKIMVALIEGESTELTEESADIAKIKLDELKVSLAKGLKDLKENQLFRYYDLPMGTVKLKAEGSQEFLLDLNQNSTTPAPIPGIRAHENLAGKFTSLLTQMTIKEKVPYSEELKFKRLAQLIFEKDKKKVTWELWIKSAKNADPYIIDPEAKTAYLMVGGTLRGYFIQLQDYWDKKVIPPATFKPFIRLSTTFTEKTKTAEVIVINKEPLAFEAPKYKIQSDNMSAVFQYLLNLGEKDQADRVSPLSKTERMQILSEDHLRIEMMGQDLLLWRKQEELIVVNLTQGFKAHFGIADEKFRADFEDVLK